MSANSQQGTGAPQYFSLLESWEEMRTNLNEHAVGELLDFVRQLRRCSEPFFGCEVCSEILEHVTTLDRDQRLHLLEEQSLFLVRTGSLDLAENLVREAVEQYGPSEELLCRWGRIWKDRWRMGLVDKRTALRNALEKYGSAFELTQRAYPGVNAAALALFLDERESANQFASAAMQSAMAVADKDEGDHWAQASIGDSLLILGRTEEALQAYQRAARLASRDLDACRSILIQAREMCGHLEIDPELLNQFFPARQIGILLGEPVWSRVPLLRAEETRVRASIDRDLLGVRPHAVYLTLASEAEIIAAEMLMEQKVDFGVVLPFRKTSFREYISLEGGKKLAERFDTVLRGAASVMLAANRTDVSEALAMESLDYADEILLGLAVLRAEGVPEDLLSIVVGSDGCSRTIRAKRRLARLGAPPPTLIQTDEQGGGSPSDRGSISRQRVCGVIFADVVGYSRMSETDIPGYMENLIGTLAQGVRESDIEVLSVNSWGDAIYVVCPDARDAGLLALELRKRVRALKWKPPSFDRPIRLRWALHAGPLFEVEDPLTGRRTFTGTHTSFAARIEPITPEGQIYTSDAFAALCAAQGVQEFSLEFAGRRELPKSFGSSRVFLLMARPSAVDPGG